MQLQMITGGRAGVETINDRVLHPRAALSNRAGITPTRVPGDMWVAPGLVTAMRPPRALRAVA